MRERKGLMASRRCRVSRGQPLSGRDTGKVGQHGGSRSWVGATAGMGGRSVERHSLTGFSEETRRASSVSRASLG